MNLYKRFLLINPLSFLSTTLMLYILRMVGPYVNYVFIPFLCMYFLYFVCHFLKNYKSINYLGILRANGTLIWISLVFIWGFIVTSAFMFPVFKEFLNIFIILFLAFSFFVFIESKSSLDKFSLIFSKQFVLFSIIVSLLGLIKFYAQLLGRDLSILKLPIQINGSSLTTDYNFYILFVLTGVISLLFLLNRYKDNGNNRIYHIVSLALLVLSMNVLFSYSRRGFIILLISLIICIIYLFAENKRKDFLYNVLHKWIIYFSISTFLIIGFVFITPIPAKRSTLNFLGINVRSFNFFSSTLLYRYSTIFSEKKYSYFQGIVWTEKPDPKKPDLWGWRIHSNEFPLLGDNVEIVPENSIGYRMDKTCNASTWNNNAYSHTDISCLFMGDTTLIKNDTLIASVYCFVSKNFNGTWAFLSAEGGASGKIAQEYDLSKSGTWQRLEIEFNSSKGIPPVYLYWSKYGVTSFKDLEGYVIYAYPEYHKKE